MDAEVYAASPPEALGSGIPLNKICDSRDWLDPQWRRSFEDLGYLYDPGRLHRKDWEFAQGVHGLRRLGCLSERSRALGLGCGHELIIYFLARRIAKVVATDLYEGNFAGQEADPRVLTRPEHYSPWPYPKERLEVRRMNAVSIDYPDCSFDIVFSFSSIEHFGSWSEKAKALREIARILKPGGIAAMTTEIILNTYGRHADFFRLGPLLDSLVPQSGMELAGGDFLFATSRETFDGLVQLPHEKDKVPHLVLRRWRTCFTSGSLFLRKPVPPGCPQESVAQRGDEIVVDMPPVLGAEVAALVSQIKVVAGANLSLDVRVKNTGSLTWERRDASGIGHVRLGAHLKDRAGFILDRDYGRSELPADIPPGGEALVRINLVAPASPGRYAVELDMLREGICWFRAVGCSATATVEVDAE